MMPRTKFREAHASPTHDSEIGDLRFAGLMPREEWAALPQPIRRRFSKRVACGESVVYVGEVVDTQLSIAGWIFAQAARLLGGPLPLANYRGTSAVVSVTEDAASGGQIWTRVYAKRRGFPQVIHSVKQFSGPTGLEEYVGGGVSMTLTVHAENGALVFRSAGYFLRFGRARFALPGWIAPGALTVTHAEEGHGRFSFLLEVVHPVFGMVIRQLACFREVSS
jgi:Domain of unknown function (DUF4166)